MTSAPMTPEQIQLMVGLLPNAESLRDISAALGVPQQTLRVAAQPFVALLRLQGALSPCGCGRERFHPYGCASMAKKARPPELAPELLERRAAVIDAIMSGDTFARIEKRLGMGQKSARRYVRYLTPEQRALRKQLEKARQEKLGPVRPFSDALYARIAEVVPLWLSPALRDDVISEMYVAVIEGALAEEEVKANAARFANAALAQFESKYGPRSIDEKLFAEGKDTLADRLPDPAALERFDALDGLRVGRLHQPEQELSL